MSYRILSLDGGGAWALIEVLALMNLYAKNTTGHKILADFDLVAANSGGSLVLGGLIENLSLSDLLTYFNDETKRRSIFSPTSSWGDRALHELVGLGPKYSADAKLPAIERLLPRNGNAPLNGVMTKEAIQRPGGSNVHLLIVGFDYDRNRATFFRSANVGGTKTAWGSGNASNATLAEAIHASTNAPVNYFDAPAQFPDKPERYWDGAITGGNNPVLAAVTEATVLGQEPMDLAVLSLGTGSVALPQAAPGDPPSIYTSPRVESGIVTDLRKLAFSILDDPPDAATFIAHVMTGGKGGVSPTSVVSRIVRMNPLISPVKDPSGIWTTPGNMTKSQFQYLCNLGMDAVEQSQINAINQFAEQWLSDSVPNQPIRIDGKTLGVEIGYALYSEAKTAWNAVK